MGSKGEQVFYFAVADSPERHATVWRLWSPRTKADVYLGSRFHAGALKLSVHESGVRHLREKPPASVPSKESIRWQGPPRDRPGIEVVWRILTPFGGIREAKLHPRFKDRVTWVPQSPRAMTATEFALVLSFGVIFRYGEWPGSDAVGAECLLRWQLHNGETLFLLRRSVDLTSEQSLWLGREILSASMSLPPDWEERRRRFNHRMHLIHDADGWRGCIDLAVDV